MVMLSQHTEKMNLKCLYFYFKIILILIVFCYIVNLVMFLYILLACILRDLLLIYATYLRVILPSARDLALSLSRSFSSAAAIGV